VGEERRDTAKIIRERPVLAERFEVIKLLGEGAAGAVFLVKDLKNDEKLVALKILTNTEAFDENTFQRFLDELHFAQSVDHPNIVTAYDFIKMNDSIAYTMEYVEGEDLASLIDTRLLSYEEIDRVMTQLLSALGELHSQGIMHRDIKLENVLISKHGVAKLVDLGLMKRLNTENKMTKTGILLGTAQYLAPEYIKHGEYVIESDIYAVGLMLYELLAGERRLQTLTGAEAIDYLLDTGFKVPKVSNLARGQIPSKYEAILEKSLNPKVKKRFSSAAEMAEAFTREILISNASSTDIRRSPLMARQCVEAESLSTNRPWIYAGPANGSARSKQRSIKNTFILPVLSLVMGAGLYFVLKDIFTSNAIPMNISFGHYEGEWNNPVGGKKAVFAKVSGNGFFLALNEPRCSGGFVNNISGSVACGDKSYRLNITDSQDGMLIGNLEVAGQKGLVVFHYAKK